MSYTIAPSLTEETLEAVLLSGPMRGQIVPVAAERELSPEELELLRKFIQLQKETGEELERMSESMQSFNKRVKAKLEAMRP